MRAVLVINEMYDAAPLPNSLICFPAYHSDKQEVVYEPKCERKDKAKNDVTPTEARRSPARRCRGEWTPAAQHGSPDT